MHRVAEGGGRPGFPEMGELLDVVEVGVGFLFGFLFGALFADGFVGVEG